MTRPRRRPFTPSLALVVGVLLAIALTGFLHRLGVVIRPDRAPAVEAGVARP